MIDARLKQLVARVDGMTVRERVLIFASILVAVVLFWYQFAMVPVINAENQALNDIKSARERIDAADSAVRAQADALNLDGGSTLAAQLDQARDRSEQINALIAARAAEIVDPATMAQVLQDLLVNQRGLRLMRAHNLKAQRLDDGDANTQLYRHTFRLELEGPYLAVLQYLEDIEALPWRLYWQGIDIDASDYPRNRVRIDVSTLSFDQDWIGV
jgi:MSHA biogenesis protein MshJ